MERGVIWRGEGCLSTLLFCGVVWGGRQRRHALHTYLYTHIFTACMYVVCTYMITPHHTTPHLTHPITPHHTTPHHT